MKLFEMKPVPKIAGLAKLHFDIKKTDVVPFRKNEDIVLPNDPELEFFPLMNGEQFLLRFKEIYEETEYWFGGTDELPFLVRLREHSFQAFQKGGEKKFYSALKPEIIIELEQAFRISAKRQGDIFTAPLPHLRDDIRCANKDNRELKRVKKQPVFGTRHKISGYYSTGIKLFGCRHAIGEGLLDAPDHAPLKLEGAHLIVQARNLYEPRLAD